jgi:hypothetical protein
MNEKKISRRDALGVIGKTGAALGAGTCFFLSLKTSPLLGALGDAPASGTAQAQAPRLKAVTSRPEKVVVSGSGSTLTVKISGPPGRHYAVAFATTDAREHYKAVANSRGYIGENGLGTVEVDVKSLPNGRVFLRIVTGKSGDFNEDIRGTQSFEVQLSNGALARFGGVHEKSLEKVEAVATCAAAGYQSKKR